MNSWWSTGRPTQLPKDNIHGYNTKCIHEYGFNLLHVVWGTETLLDHPEDSMGGTRTADTYGIAVMSGDRMPV